MMLSAAAAYGANPAPGDILKITPKQSVTISTPTDAELAKCTVELIRGTKLANGKTSSGWMLKDGDGRMVRRFFDTEGDGHLHVWSYYHNGEEVYREIDTNSDGKADQYRWLGSNGSKWGIDRRQTGQIDSWAVISPEEVSQEILAAVLTKDFARLQSLMITKEDLDTLQLPEAESNRIRTAITGSQAKFTKTLTTLKTLGEKTKWIHLETKMPQTIPADVLGARLDLVRHKQGTILYPDGDKHDWLQTGELIQVGRAWKIIDAPAPGSIVDAPSSTGEVAGGGSNVDLPDEAKPFLDKLKELDGSAPKQGDSLDKIAKYNVDRALILEKIVPLVKGTNRDQWIRQIADCLNAAVQSTPKDKAPYDRLVQWQTVVEKDGPGSNTAAYVAYRVLSANYSRKLSETKNADMVKLQEEWRDSLTKFVTNYATAEDTPDALIQLGMLNEFMGKEIEAKNSYTRLVKNFDKHPMVTKAQGAIDRLGLDGKDFALAGTTLGAGNPFDIKTLKGKVVIVYYWSGNNEQCASDFAKIKTLLSIYQNKVELVCVNLDTQAKDAMTALRATPVSGIHLHSPGNPETGTESPLGTQYGIFVLPNTFLIGADGKVINRNAQVPTLDDDLKKLFKEEAAKEEKK